MILASVSGGGEYAPGDKVTIKAVTKSGYTFCKWTSNKKDLVPDSESATYTFTMPSADVILVANVKTPAETTTSSATASGKCGANVTWEFDKSNGTLTISGTGAMYDYNYEAKNRPWESYGKEIKKVVIKNGVTTI